MDSDFVTSTDCTEKHKPINWFITTIMGLVSLLIILVGWSTHASQSAVAESRKAQITVEVYAAGAEERHLSIAEKLDSIQMSQIRMDHRLDQFYRKNGGQ